MHSDQQRQTSHDLASKRLDAAHQFNLTPPHTTVNSLVPRGCELILDPKKSLINIPAVDECPVLSAVRGLKAI